MALDVYVMPLWRFKAGDFASPVEKALGVEPTIISLAAEAPPRTPWHLRLLARLGLVEVTYSVPEPEPDPEERRALAIREVDSLKRELTRMVGTPVDWPDVGDVLYGEQYGHPEVLRAFAAWHDHREELSEFESAPDGNYYNHPVWQLPKPPARRFPTLVEHNLNTGYFLPVPFEGCYNVEPFKLMGHWECFHTVASSQTILREVTDLLGFLSTLPAHVADSRTDTPEDIRWYAEELQRICALSVQRSLPVIFYG